MSGLRDTPKETRTGSRDPQHPGAADWPGVMAVFQTGTPCVPGPLCHLPATCAGTLRPGQAGLDQLTHLPRGRPLSHRPAPPDGSRGPPAGGSSDWSWAKNKQLSKDGVSARAHVRGPPAQLTPEPLSRRPASHPPEDSISRYLWLRPTGGRPMCDEVPPSRALTSCSEKQVRHLGGPERASPLKRCLLLNLTAL